jgi:putative flippase GtrA
MRFINREFFRFILWGAVNTLAGYLIYVLLLLFLPYMVSYTVTYVIIVSMSYVLNAKFVFNERLAFKRAIKYPVVYVVQYLLGAASLYFLAAVLGVNKLVAPFLIVFVTIPVTFFLSRRIIGGKKAEIAKPEP